MRWIAGFAMALGCLAGAFAALNYVMDFYGLFGPVKGREIKVYANERTTKYLLSFRYIPENFDGLLVGSSTSRTMDVSAIGGARVYNASIAGANISEEKLIAENVLDAVQPKLVIFALHPYLTASVGRKSGYMVPSEYWGALGSVGLLRVYIKYASSALGIGRDRFDASGVNDEFDIDPAQVELVGKGPPPVTVNEAAFAEYAALVARARESGARLVAYIPPIPAATYAARRDEYDAYFARMRALFEPDEQVIDFNAPQYAAYTSVSETFYDGAHLAPAASRYFSDELARLIDEGAAD